MFQLIFICVSPVLLVVSLPDAEAAENSGVGRKLNVHVREKRETEEAFTPQWCGLPGRDGRDGRDGIQGPYGPPGQKGEPGNPGRLKRMEKTLETLNAKFSEVLQNHARSHDENFNKNERALRRSNGNGTKQRLVPKSNIKPAGAVYTRWGKNSCPGDADKLYHGVVVGSHFQHTGSGANYLCLPLNPQWNRTVAGHQSKSYIYGTEFEIFESNAGFHRQNSDGKTRHNHEAQCSVCHTPGRQSHVMIPARLECPDGWTLEYIGFLMSSYYKEKRSEYVCVDQDPDVHPGTSADENGALFYVTEVACGSLPCPPFADGFEVTCVVCTN